MTTKQDLREAEEKVDAHNKVFEEYRNSLKLSKEFFKVGLGCVAYLGLRFYFGPEIDSVLGENSIITVVPDTLGMVGSYGCLISGISSLTLIPQEKEKERNLRYAQSELEVLSENYKFERGHI